MALGEWFEARLYPVAAPTWQEAAGGKGWGLAAHRAAGSRGWVQPCPGTWGPPDGFAANPCDLWLLPSLP